MSKPFGAKLRARSTSPPRKQSAKAKDRFVSQVSHELRTPLTSIQGFLAMLLDDDADELSAARPRRVSANRRAKRRPSAPPRRGSPLRCAQVDEGEFALVKTEFDLGDVTAEAVAGAQPAADKRQITLQARSETKLSFLGDRNRLAQVLDNLLSNAVKFTAKGGDVTVDTTRSNGNVRVMVTDTGVGMRPDEIGHLFERFYRTDAATTAAVPGSGLGLAISKAIVEAHGGTITADSRLSVGTSITVELPTGK